MKYTFSDLKDSKSFTISYLASLFVVFLMVALEIYGCYIPRVAISIINITGYKGFLSDILSSNYICPQNIFWMWVVFIILLILVWKGVGHYLSLKDVQEEIDAAKSIQKRKK